MIDIETKQLKENTINIGFVRGGPMLILRMEGLAVLAVACLAYARVAPGQGWGWGMFALLFLLPDLSMLGYAGGKRLGAIVYNVGHSYLTPALLAAAGYWQGETRTSVIALIWIAHIGFDRLAGYGLKYASGFGDTHLGRRGKAISAAAPAA